MPLKKRRSSTRFKPRVLVGNNRSIRAHCSSENQNNSAIFVLPRQGRLNPRSSDSHTLQNELKGLGPSEIVNSGWAGLVPNYSLLTLTGSPIRSPPPTPLRSRRAQQAGASAGARV